MTILDFLYITLAVGFLITVIFVAFAAYEVATTLKTLKKVLNDLSDTTNDVRLAKDFIKLSSLGIIKKLIEILR